MVSQITPQQTLAPPQPIYQPTYQNYSPELTAALAVLERAYQQQNQQQASPQTSPSQVRTSQQTAGGYGGSGAMMGNIDPAVLLAQWQALQTQNLPQTAVPIVNNPINPVLQQYQQAAGLTQQVPQQTTVSGEFLTQPQIDALTNFIQSANNLSAAAENYVSFLESEYSKLRDFSNKQHNLIERFLHDREFTLEYIRGAWVQESIDNELANAIATVYMEIDRLFPRNQQEQPPIQNPAYTGGNVRMDAQVVDTAAPTPYVSIPALPNGNASVDPGSITVEQYFAARDNGNMREAVLAAYRDPTALYAAMYR